MQDYNSEKFKSINPQEDSKKVFEFGKMTERGRHNSIYNGDQLAYPENDSLSV